jgi:branched-subunit amino acid aminotransferase/4-amino-4-deoxychorismate lyase
VLEARMVQERVDTKDDLRGATRIWLINSLREWIPSTLVP